MPRAARGLQAQRGDLLTIPRPDAPKKYGERHLRLCRVISGGLVYEISPKSSATSDGMDSDG
ncbi:hypothetical protein C4D60_Mb02t05860 [Musa balbisiana]|uniref:Uncharacterized protein n=1 Tax=Musa balbisiana TaxID=52838 RepID=A0A4S8I8S0_MUSBA|nr:hypothetical protein C4D60_Mb02t05860 [Musa balbisiana]